MQNLYLAQIFGDHCVLQRGKNICVFGKGAEGAEVTVSLFQGELLLATARTKVKEGRFLVKLPPQQAKTGCGLQVESGEETIFCRDVAIGEVWLAGGQSNMELELRNMKDGSAFLEQETDHHVRFYYTQKNSYMDDFFYTQESWSHWATFEKKESECWSAVAYLTARELADQLKMTVGVIGCNWGGTSASAWMSRESLMRDAQLRSYVDEYDEAVKGLSEAEQVAAFDRYTQEYNIWNEQCAKLYSEQPDISWEEVNEILGPCQYPGPMNCKNPFRPAGLHECMILRVAPYTLRGFWFYQGESDDHKPQMYERLLTAMIGQWREDWLDKELPFIFVQLPMHRWKQDPDLKHWCIIREAQMNVYQTIKNTGIAVAIDCGEFNEIHPKDKRPVAHRLYLQTLWQVYQPLTTKTIVSEKDCFAPVFKMAIGLEKGMEIMVDYADDGFVVTPHDIVSADEDGRAVLKASVSGFEIAGEDGEFVPADAILQKGHIQVYAEGVSTPKQVRYLWTNYGQVYIYGRNGLPLAPFRS